ncbi:hypothetical protein BDZ91DRAFT_768399 [Kalaharituber pfeilii]|nr:hypothetical protein BDZ91DRAFT_768399 [Kalaharituber pfeilii]
MGRLPGWTALHHAAWAGWAAGVRVLVEDAGMCPFEETAAERRTPLHLAAGEVACQVGHARELPEREQQRRVAGKVNMEGREGRTPLAMAVRHRAQRLRWSSDDEDEGHGGADGGETVAQWLLRQREGTAGHPGNTALLLAAKEGTPEAVRQLLERGGGAAGRRGGARVAHGRQRPEESHTALARVQTQPRRGDVGKPRDYIVPLTMLLRIAPGVDLRARDRHERTPLMWAAIADSAEAMDARRRRARATTGGQTTALVYAAVHNSLGAAAAARGGSALEGPTKRRDPWWCRTEEENNETHMDQVRWYGEGGQVDGMQIENHQQGKGG